MSLHQDYMLYLAEKTISGCLAIDKILQNPSETNHVYL